MAIILDKAETRDGLAIYWFVNSVTNQRVYGIAFDNGLFNIANQELAESLSLSNDIMDSIADQFLNSSLDLTKPVRTRCGYKAYIGCTDMPGDYPIFGYYLIDKWPHLCKWTRDGSVIFGDPESQLDLVQDV